MEDEPLAFLVISAGIELYRLVELKQDRAYFSFFWMTQGKPWPESRKGFKKLGLLKNSSEEREEGQCL